jgi:hypothetical protein
MSKKNQNTINAFDGYEVTITVPSTFNVGEPIDKKTFNLMARSVELAFSKRYGGATSVLGNGSYVAKNDAIVSEPVWLVSTYIDHAPTVEDTEFFKGIVYALKVALHQEAITLVCRQIQYCFI